jgi:hypothetical protein
MRRIVKIGLGVAAAGAGYFLLWPTVRAKMATRPTKPAGTTGSTATQIGTAAIGALPGVLASIPGIAKLFDGGGPATSTSVDTSGGAGVAIGAGDGSPGNNYVGLATGDTQGAEAAGAVDASQPTDGGTGLGDSTGLGLGF